MLAATAKTAAILIAKLARTDRLMIRFPLFQPDNSHVGRIASKWQVIAFSWRTTFALFCGGFAEICAWVPLDLMWQQSKKSLHKFCVLSLMD